MLVSLLAGTVLPFAAAFLADRTLFGRSMEAAALQAMAFTDIPILTPLIGDKATIVVDIAGLTGNIVILPATFVLLSYAWEQKPSEGKACQGGQGG